MTRKKRRLILILVCGVGVGSAAALTLSAFKQNLMYFVSPTDLAKSDYNGRQVRLGGLVQQGTVKRTTGTKADVTFRVTDGKSAIPVTYKGILPDLFREGQGVVVLGTERSDGVFHASEVLAKHDETYMPKEVVEALKKSGEWNPATGEPPPNAAWDRAASDKAASASKPPPG
ncbi:MAG: cytochrome c biogenesis protein CcmE [Rhodospirillales bacterium 20-64-7]|nr:MAG: cytochrome c biogenesis protein CcmE [Rhodospirillales bacterium 20-64-7]HQT80381.1 cytochrome c maturation protein CcmE [Rhodopila sp.]